MVIFVNTRPAKTTELEVSPSDTIGNIKRIVCHKEGFLPYQYQMTFTKQELEDGQTLSDYNIKEDSFLHLKLKGEPSFS